MIKLCFVFFFFKAEDGIRDYKVTGFRRVLFRSDGPRTGCAASDRQRDAEQRDRRAAWDRRGNHAGSREEHSLETRAARPYRGRGGGRAPRNRPDRKSTRLNSSHLVI